MKKLTLLLCLVGHYSISQTIFQIIDVEKQAVPSGGVSMLNLFISSNMQLPIRTTSKGIDSKVFLKGIVETDGSMTGLEIVRGIDSGCNQEAIRLMTMYRAWKPALIKGLPVRQSLVYPVVFKISPDNKFDSTLNALVYYYDEKDVATDQKETAKKRFVVPVDRYGYVKHDILWQNKKKRGGWQTTKETPVKRKEIFVKSHESTQPDSVAVTEVTTSIEENNIPSQILRLKKDGTLMSFTDYNASGSPTLSKSYYANGVLKQAEEVKDGMVRITRWFKSGVIEAITELKTGPSPMNALVIRGAWDKEGNSLLKDGQGWCRLPSESYRGKMVLEEGMVKDGLKSGKWVGKLEDGTLFFEEYYEEGILLNGVALENGTQTDYKVGSQQPEFAGGITGMYRFLAENIRYPINASKSRIAGRVLLSFVVCEDGSLCDYQVTKGVERSLDTEALRVVKLMSGKWTPGIVRGRKVRVKYNLPVNFQLN